MSRGRSLLSPEARVVLLADGHERPSEEIAGLLDTGLDWHRLLVIVDRERAALPVWRTIRAQTIDIARPELQVLKHMADVWEFRLMHLERLLHEVVDALDGMEIEPVLLKGAGLAVSAYHDFSARPMVDLDVLVPAERADEAWEAARGLGWRWNAEKCPREAFVEAHHLAPLTDAFGAGLALEIHRELWMPDHPFAFGAARVLDASVPVERGGRRFRVPRPDHQLLHCCIHFAWSHRIRGHAWRAFSDVRALLAGDGVDWTSFAELAAATGAETCSYWTLRLARELGAVHVPASVLETLRPRLPGALLDRLARHFTLNLLADEDQCPSVAIERQLWHLAIQRGRGSAGIALPSDPEGSTITEKVSHHTRAAGTWLRYLRRLA